MGDCCRHYERIMQLTMGALADTLRYWVTKICCCRHLEILIQTPWYVVADNICCFCRHCEILFHEMVGSCCKHHEMHYRTPWDAVSDTMRFSFRHHKMQYRTQWDAVSCTMRCCIIQYEMIQHEYCIRYHDMLYQTPWDAESDTMRCCVRHQAETLAAPCSVDCYQVTTQYILLVITTFVLLPSLLCSVVLNYIS